VIEANRQLEAALVMPRTGQTPSHMAAEADTLIGAGYLASSVGDYAHAPSLTSRPSRRHGMRADDDDRAGSCLRAGATASGV